MESSKQRCFGPKARGSPAQGHALGEDSFAAIFFRPNGPIVPSGERSARWADASFVLSRSQGVALAGRIVAPSGLQTTKKLKYFLKIYQPQAFSARRSHVLA